MVSHQPIDGFDILGFKPLDISIYANDVEKSDWHNDLPEKGPKTASDEVFVYAKPKKYSGKIILGRPGWKHCRSITYQFASEKIKLECMRVENQSGDL